MPGRHVAPGKGNVVMSWLRDSLANESKRKSIYGVVTAVLAVMTAYGVVTADDAAQYGEAASTLLGALAMFLARVNTGNAVERTEAVKASDDMLVVEALDTEMVDDA